MLNKSTNGRMSSKHLTKDTKPKKLQFVLFGQKSGISIGMITKFTLHLCVVFFIIEHSGIKNSAY